MTPQGDARGAVVHDCTSFSPDDNLVGPVLASFSFADCFASRALAQPRIAMSDRGMLRLSSDTVERSRGFLEEWMGLREGCSKEGTGITIEDPRKLAFSATFDNGTQLAHNRREEFHQSEAEQTPSHTLAVAQGVLPCSSQALLSSAVSCSALWTLACQCSGGSLQVGVLVLVRRWRLLWVQTGHTRSICCRSRHRLQAGAQARERRQQGRGG